MTTHVSTAPRHTHQCSECGRPFYLCSERDCEMAPDTCRACELDRQDAFFDQIEVTRLTPSMFACPNLTPQEAEMAASGIAPVVIISEDEFRAKYSPKKES